MDDVGNNSAEYDTDDCIPIDHCLYLCILIVLLVEEIREDQNYSTWRKSAVEDV